MAQFQSVLPWRRKEGARRDRVHALRFQAPDTTLLMLRCDPGLDPGEPRSTHRRRCIGRVRASRLAFGSHLRMRAWEGGPRLAPQDEGLGKSRDSVYSPWYPRSR